jgi:hypothetical protein
MTEEFDRVTIYDLYTSGGLKHSELKIETIIVK